MSNEMDVVAVRALVATFEKDFNVPIKDAIKRIDGEIETLNEQIATLQTKSRDQTYNKVAALVTLAQALNISNPSAGYNAFLAERGIVAPDMTKAGANPYPKFIKAVFSVQVGSVWSFTDRSVEKHANHVRFLVNAMRDGTLTGSVQNFIRDFKHATHGNMLDGIEANDRFDNKTDAQEKRIETVRQRGRDADPVVTFDSPLGFEDGSVVSLWGRVVGGNLEIMFVESANDDKDSLYYKLGKTIKAA